MRCLSLLTQVTLASAITPDYAMKWKDFKERYQKWFLEEEEPKRFEIFKKNVDAVYHYNGKNLSFQLGINEYAHLDPDEFANIYSGLKKPKDMWGDLPNLGTQGYSGEPLEASVDWTMKGAVTPIKNQGQCGSCWAFSTTGALEGAWKIKSGKLISLSEQQLVDCDKVDDGCSGGLMDNGFKYAEKAAMCTEDSYSYKGSKGTCQASGCSVGVPLGGVTGYTDVKKDDKEALMQALQQQPVSIAIEADKQVFQLYRSGVLTGLCGTSLDHGVLAVGYGTKDSVDYWKVKNSWGPGWGMDGYVLIKRGKPGAGECGLLSGPPSYPIVTGKPGPSPAPGPSPTPPPPSPTPPPSPGCADEETQQYCDYAKKEKYCNMLHDHCKKTCGCCDANKPDYCSNRAAQSAEAQVAEEAVKMAVKGIVV